MKPITLWAFVALALLLISGCGSAGDDLPKTVDAEGTLTVNGQAYEGASIVFVPVDGQYPAFGASDATGRFALKAFEAKSGAVPGTYKVQVSKTIEVPDNEPLKAADLGEDAEHAEKEESSGRVQWMNDLPAKYGDPDTSDIVIDIPMDGVLDIQLKLEK